MRAGGHECVIAHLRYYVCVRACMHLCMRVCMCVRAYASQERTKIGDLAAEKLGQQYIAGCQITVNKACLCEIFHSHSDI